ncbi:hypothetical protein HanIR_Chr13g0650981 [Helianthus annuus]|nr:hypothetical protein HanIR_Chr13g0650981 [Helianthus annuus]
MGSTVVVKVIYSKREKNCSVTYKKREKVKWVFKTEKLFRTWLYRNAGTPVDYKQKRVSY